MKTLIYYILIYSVSLLIIIGCSESITPTESQDDKNDELELCWEIKTPMPTVRQGHSACILDGKIYIMGGADKELTLVDGYNTVDVYDPSQDAWTNKADMLLGRANFATFVLNGKIYAVGGAGSFYYGCDDTIEEYNPITDTWSEKTTMPRPRMGLTATVANDKVYIIGGSDCDEDPIAEIDIYDPATDTWFVGASIPTPRSHLAAALFDEKIYTISGTIGPDALYEGRMDVEEYDPTTDTWTVKTNIGQSRRYFMACTLNGKIYVFGGTNGLNRGGFLSVEEYDPAIDAWTFKSNLPHPKAAASVVAFNEKAYVMGGTPDYPRYDHSEAVNVVYEYNPELDN